MKKNALVAVACLLGMETFAGRALAQQEVIPPPPPALPETGRVVVQPTAPVLLQTTDDRPLRTARALVGSGVAIFGVTYLATVIASAVTSNADNCAAADRLGCRDANWPVYIPVVGPFIQMGYMSGEGARNGQALLAVDGAIQAGGVALIIAGAAMRASYNRSHVTRLTKLQLAPTGTGLVAFGRF